MQCSLIETVHWDNVTPKDDITASTDVVWVKRPRGQCTTQFKKRKVTKVYSPHSVLVDGVPRHVKDIHPVHRPETTSSHITTLDEETPMVYEGQMQEEMTISTGSVSGIL